MTPPSPIPSLHAAYAKLTGSDLVLTSNREYMWHLWLKQRAHDPFTAFDLELVIRMIRQGIKDGTRNPGALRFSNLIGDPEGFEEQALYARGLYRIPKPNTARASVLAATGRAEPQAKADPEQVAAVVKRCMEQIRKEVE